MQNTYLEHPSEEMLERYILHQSSERELDSIETHVLACEDCITRLEDLESYIAVFRQASSELQLERAEQPIRESVITRLLGWLTPQRISLIGAAAALAVVVSVAPVYNSSHRDKTPIHADLSAWRGAEMLTLASNRPLDLRLNASDLPARELWAELVDSRGSQLWKGATAVHDEFAEVTLPALPGSRNYFVRLYATRDNGTGTGDLLREFSFQTK
jgi:hypothetical protein